MKRRAFIVAAALAALTVVHAEIDPSIDIKLTPQRPPEGAEVVISDIEILPGCAEDKICVEGLLANTGSKTAREVRVRIDIGGMREGHPRLSLFKTPEDSEMNPGDSQLFEFQIDRRVSYQYRGEEKTIQVGRFNFHLVPVWVEEPAEPAGNEPVSDEPASKTP